jgi:hypothetical protein
MSGAYRGQDLTQDEIYKQTLDSRAKLLAEQNAGLQDLAPVEPGVGSAATGMPQPAQNQTGSQISQAGQMTTAGGMAAGNPYVAGAGIALQGLGMVDNAKRQQEQAKIDAYNQKIMAQRAAARNIFA